MGVMLSVLLPSGAWSDEKIAVDLVPADIKAKGVISVALVADYPPYGFKDDSGKEIGIDVDLLDAIGRKLKVEMKYTSVAFETIVPSVNNARFDIGAGGLGDFKSRQEVVDIVDAYMTVDGLIVPKGNPKKLSNEHSLCGLKLVAANGGVEIPLIQKLSSQCVASGKSEIALQIYDDTAASLLALQNQRGDAAPYDMATAVYLTRNNYPKLEAVTGTLPGSTSLDGYAISKKKPKLSKAIESAIQELITSGEYLEILKKWGIEANDVKAASTNQGWE